MPAIVSGLNNRIPTSVSATAGTATINNTTGMVTVSNASDIVVDGVFSSAFDNYLINIHGNATAAQVAIRLRTAGTASTDSTNYWWHNAIYYNNSYTYQNQSTAAATSGIIGYTSPYGTIAQILVGSPFISTQRTVIYADVCGEYSNPSMHKCVVHHNVTASYAGFVFIVTGFTGTISTYGFTK